MNFVDCKKLIVDFGLALATKDIESVEGQGFHLVLAREAVDGGEEAYALTQTADDVVRVSQSASQQYGINLSAEDGSLGSDVLGYMVDHGIEDELGLLVAVLNALQHFLHVVGAKVGVESRLAGNALQQLFLVVLATEAETDEVGGGQRAGTLRREGSFAIECVVGIDGAPVVVGCYGDAAAHVTDNKVQVLVGTAHL